MPFAKFLKDFSTGSHIFTNNEFEEDNAAALKRLGIEYIKVNYKISNHNPVIKILNTTPVSTPDIIVQCGLTYCKNDLGCIY